MHFKLFDVERSHVGHCDLADGLICCVFEADLLHFLLQTFNVVSFPHHTLVTLWVVRFLLLPRYRKFRDLIHRLLKPLPKCVSRLKILLEVHYSIFEALMYKLTVQISYIKFVYLIVYEVKHFFDLVSLVLDLKETSQLCDKLTL